MSDPAEVRELLEKPMPELIGLYGECLKKDAEEAQDWEEWRNVVNALVRKLGPMVAMHEVRLVELEEARKEDSNVH